MHSIHLRTRAAVLATLLLLPFAAHAQTRGGGIALNQFDPAPAGDRFFNVPSPFAEGHLVPRAMALFDYAHEPLVVTDGVNSGAIVATQGFLHVGASLSLSDRMLLSAHQSIALLQSGDNPTVGGVPFSSPAGAQLGDLRLGARIRLAGENDEPFQLGVGASFYLPTAPADSFAGEGAFRFSPEVIAGGHVSQFVWSAAIRPMFRTSSNPATINHGAGVALLLAENRLQLGLEYLAATPLQEGFISVSDGKTIRRGLLSNAELHVTARGRIVSGLWAGVAAGPGMTDAIGTPQFRVTGMIGWLGAPKK